MNPRMYVGGLSSSTTDQQLGDLCAPYGTVKSARLITSKITSLPLGHGFVEMGSAEEARNAIAALNGSQLEGQTLRCFSM